MKLSPINPGNVRPVFGRRTSSIGMSVEGGICQRIFSAPGLERPLAVVSTVGGWLTSGFRLG